MNTIKTKKTKRCESCNVQFEYTQPTAKYCSNACKCQAYSKRIKRGQTNISVSGYSSNHSNELNDLKAYVQQLEKQMEYMMQSSIRNNEMVLKTLSEMAESHIESMNSVRQEHRKELDHLNQVKIDSQNKSKDEENTQKMIGSLISIFSKK
jgi:copper homeostasis protein CutC